MTSETMTQIDNRATIRTFWTANFNLRFVAGPIDRRVRRAGSPWYWLDIDRLWVVQSKSSIMNGKDIRPSIVWSLVNSVRVSTLTWNGSPCTNVLEKLEVGEYGSTRYRSDELVYVSKCSREWTSRRTIVIWGRSMYSTTGCVDKTLGWK